MMSLISEINWTNSVTHNTHNLFFFTQYTQLNLKRLIREKENDLLCWQFYQWTQAFL